MTDFMRLARGKPCLVRLPCCDGGGETTVGAHFRMLPYCGTGIKPSPDWIWISWCCGPCHAAVDFRDTTYEKDFVRMAHMQGILRTQMELVKLGFNLTDA